MKLPGPWLTQAHTIHRVVQVNLRRILLHTVLLGLVFSALLAVPFVFYHQAETENNLSLRQAEQERVIKLAAGAIQQEMDAVLSDLRYLSQHNEISKYLAQPTDSNRLDLASEYRALALQKHLYDQISFIGLDGVERVRVAFNRQGSPAIVAQQQLRDCRDQAYFAEGLRLLPGQIHVSPLALDPAPGGAGQVPKPVIRFVVPVVDERGTIHGMVVLNYLGRRLLDKLGALEGHAGKLRLLDAAGQWLMGADPQGEWGFIDPERSGRNLAGQSPRLWLQMQSEPSGVHRTDDAWVRFERVYPLLGENATTAGAKPIDAERYHWTVAVELSPSAMRAANYALLKKLWTVYGVLLLFAFLVAGALTFALSRNQALAKVMEKVVDNVPVLVAYVDAEQRYRFNNMAYERFFGLRPKQIYGKSMRALLGEVAYQEARPYIEQALAGQAVNFERQLSYAGAGARDVTVSYLPDTSPEGEVRGFYVLVNDVSLIKASQRRERQHMLELAHVSRLASMGEMATEIAHEINQPLAAISMYSAAGLRTLQGEWDRGKLESWLEAINSQAKRASEIVRRVRRFVQKGEPQLGPVDLNLIARETAALVAQDARAQEVEIVLELAEGLPLVQAERVLLEQVVFNLVRNAMDAVLVGSGERRVTLRTAFDVQLVYVEVSDTGPGVDPALGEQIFDSFVTSKQGGLGMGLAISRSIAEAHGGTLRYAARAGGGTSFTFSLVREAG